VFNNPVEVSTDVNLLFAEDVNVFKLLLDASIAVSLVFVVPLYETNEPVTVSIKFNLLFVEDVNAFKLPVEDSKLVNLVLTDELNTVRSIPSIVPVMSIEPEITMSLANTTGVPLTED